MPWRATKSAVGTVPAVSKTAGVSVTERNQGELRQTIFTLSAVSLTVTDTGGAAGAHCAIQLYDFPAGLIDYLGGTTDLAITAGAGGIADGAAVVGSVGTVTVGVGNATLTGTEADLIPSTASTLAAGVGATKGKSTATEKALHDGTATAKDVFLNFAVPDADVSASDTLSVTGTVTLTWINHGDN